MVELGLADSEGGDRSAGGAGGMNPDVTLSNELLSAYAGARSKWADNAQADNDFRNGIQWTTTQERELKRKKQSPVVVNVIYPAIEQIKAAMTSNDPRFSAAGREGSDIKVASLFADILSYIWYHSNGKSHLKRVIDDYLVAGIGVWSAYVDPNADNGKGEVCFQSIDPLHVYTDPNAQDLFCRDAAHIMIARIYTKPALLHCYPQYRDLIERAQPTLSDHFQPASLTVSEQADGGGSKPTEAIHTKYWVIDRYTKVKTKRIHVYDPQSGFEDVLSEDGFQEFLKKPAVIEQTGGGNIRFITNTPEVLTALRMIDKTGGTFHYTIDQQDPSATPRIKAGPEDMQMDASMGLTTIPGSTVVLKAATMMDAIKANIVQVTEIWADRVMRTFSIGDQLAYKDLLDIEEYPIIIAKPEDCRTPFPSSPVRKVRPLQEYINKIRSLIQAHASNSTNVKLALPRGSYNKQELLAEMEKAGVGLLEYDAELGTAVVVGPIPLPNELYKNEADARRDIQEILGAYTVSMGDPSTAPTTYKGTIAIDEYGQRRIKSMKDDIEESMNQLARVVVQLVQKTYTEQKAIRIIRPNNSPISFEVNTPVYDDNSGELRGRLNDITVGKIDIVVVSGSTLPVNRWARFEYYMELYKNGIIDQEEVLKQTEVADVEGVLRRASEINRLRQALAQAQDQLKMMRGDMQTLQRESMHDRKRVEIEKFKSDLEQEKSRVAASATVFGERLKDEVRNTRKAVAASPKGKTNSR